MPYADPEKRRERSRRRNAQIKADPELREKYQAKERERYRLKMSTAAGRAREAEIRRQWRKKNPEKTRRIHRRHNLKRLYGITPEDYAQMLKSQGGGCAICGRADADDGGKKLHVDHCHESGEVRGILCSNCNQGIGKFRHDPELLSRAIDYVRRAPQSGAAGGRSPHRRS